MANWNSVYGLGPDRVPGIDFEEQKGNILGQCGPILDLVMDLFRLGRTIGLQVILLNRKYN